MRMKPLKWGWTITATKDYRPCIRVMLPKNYFGQVNHLEDGKYHWSIVYVPTDDKLETRVVLRSGKSATWENARISLRRAWSKIAKEKGLKNEN